jgi:hypothetical protein
MEGNGNIKAAAPTEERKRIRSEIEFPYADLENAVELAQILHSRAGTSCELTELAAWMNQSVTGGTFRTRVSAAKIFGLIETTQGRATLTQLGRDILDKGSERSARCDAFLNTELFLAMYEQNKGNVLPPPAAIERQMEGLGVSPRQKERARQTFMKSANFAGFLDPSSGRFIKPGNVSAKADPAPQKEKGGAGGEEPPSLHPFVQGLLRELPKAGDVWPETKRKLWLDTAGSIFKMIYKDDPDRGSA